MKRNSTTLFLESPGAVTPVPWVNGKPDFSGFTPPTLWSLQKAWDERDGEPEVIPDPGPAPEPVVPNWPGFNAFMLTNAMFKSYRDAVRAIDPELTPALYDAYALVSANGVDAFGLLWGVWCGFAQITAEDRQAIADVAAGFNLPTDFVTVVRGS